MMNIGFVVRVIAQSTKTDCDAGIGGKNVRRSWRKGELAAAIQRQRRKLKLNPHVRQSDRIDLNRPNVESIPASPGMDLDNSCRFTMAGR